MARKGASTNAIVAASIDAPVRALPLIPELFAPLRALGSGPRRVVAWLRAAGLRPGDRVLDLGCGKGAVAVALADRMGCRVVGVDAFGPFIESARNYAQKRGVATLCEFRCARIESWRRARRSFDAVVILGVCAFDRALQLARPWTRPGGFYLIDDAVRVKSAGQVPLDSASFQEVPSAQEARHAIEQTGDAVKRSYQLSRSESRRLELALYGKLRNQAAVMSRQNPRRRELLNECLRRQAEAIAVLTGPLRGALWLVRRK